MTTGGKAARIFVEGRDLGPAPVTVTLFPGQYRVSAVAGEATVRGAADLSQGDQKLAVDVGLAEAFRPDPGPALAVSPASQAAAVVQALAPRSASNSSSRSPRSTTRTCATSRRRSTMSPRGAPREGRIRLADWTPPPGAIPGAGGLPRERRRVGPRHREAREARPVRVGRVGRPDEVELQPREPAPPRPGGSRTMGWVAFSSGVLAVGVGAFAAYEGFSASGKYSDAKSMLASDGTLSAGRDPAAYNGAVRDADSAVNVSRVSAGAAVGLAATSAVLGDISYKRTGEIGPIRF